MGREGKGRDFVIGANAPITGQGVPLSENVTLRSYHRPGGYEIGVDFGRDRRLSRNVLYNKM